MARDSATKQAVLIAATSIFAEQGFGAASISKIATAAGVSKATVFHHFGNKDNLYLEVLLQTFHLIADAWGKSIDNEETNFNVSLKVLVMDTLDFQQQHADSLKLLIWEVLGAKRPSSSAVGPGVFHQYFKKIIGVIEILISKSTASKKFNANKIAFDLLSHSIFYFIFGDSLIGMDELPFIESAEGFSDWLVKGILLPSTNNQ